MLHILSVGHGTCVIGELSDGTTLCYDAGSLSNFNLAESLVIPFLRQQGIRQIDRLFLSHANLDHYSGVIDLCQSFPVGKIYCSDTLEDKMKRASRYSALGTLFQYLNANAQIVSLHRGICLPPAKKPLNRESAAIEVLWPPPIEQTGHFNTNDCSLVLRIEDRERSFLLTGDIGEIPQRQLLSEPNSSHLQADVLLLPHHGSVDESLPEFVATVGSPYLINSCGFLGPRQLKRLTQAIPDRRIWHTFQSGCISVVTDKDTVKVISFQ